MTASNLPAPVLITLPADLKRLVETLRREPILAVDTESNSLYAYREQVCLVQFSTPASDSLVDPLALQDLAPLAALFSDSSTEKVFHAAEYDLICLSRDFGFKFANLFDTMAACRILGRPAVGLGAILETEFGVQLDKRGQRANWGQRPLSPQLLDYARLDTHYLIPLRHCLRSELEERGLLPLAQEDFNRLCAIDANAEGGPDSQNKVVDVWRVGGSHDLDPRQAAVLQELCFYRDRVARAIDRPLFKVFGDRTLLAIAESTPGSLEELGHLPGMSPNQMRRHGERLLQAVRRGLRSKPIRPPRSPRPNERYLDRLEALRNWRKAAAEKMGVASDIVLPRDLLFKIAEQNPLNSQELMGVMSDVPWRRERFGEQIIGSLNKVRRT